MNKRSSFKRFGLLFVVLFLFYFFRRCGDVARKRNRIDWLTIKQAYITSQDITLKELADIFGISENAICKQSTKENWTEKRKQYQEKVFKKTCNKIADKAATRLAKLSDRLLDKIEQAVEELHIHEEVNGFGDLIYQNTETVRTNKLEKLVKSVALLEKNELEKEKIKIEREKLQGGDGAENKVLEYMKVLKEGLKDDTES